MTDIKITQQMINVYRAMIGNSVMTDSAILDKLQKQLEAGTLPKEFALLFSDAQKVGNNSCSLNLFRYGFCENDVLGLSIEKTLNKTGPSLEAYEESSENLPNETIENAFYLASDGNEYDIKDYLFSRVYNLYRYLENDSTYMKANAYFLEFLGPENTYKNFEKSYNYDEALLEKIDDVEQLFVKLTGYEYEDENIEKFLLGEIKIVSEIAAEKYLEKKLEIKVVKPQIPQTYVSQNKKQELSSSRKILNKEEEIQYDNIKNLLPEEYQKKLTNILSSGRLLQDDSEGNLTVLSSLYKIVNDERLPEINNIELLKDCIDILDNPYIITQRAEDIPEEYQDEFKKRFLAAEKKSESFYKITTNIAISADNSLSEESGITEEEFFKYRSIGTCAAASLEFELATKQPAEFFRIVERLSSNRIGVFKTIELQKSDKHLVEFFETRHAMIEPDKFIVRLSPDENAYLLSEIQNKYQDDGERSIVDILMQSVIMNLGSRQTYDSINDRRAANELTNNNDGLIVSEINFARKILVSSTSYYREYKKLDSAGKIKNLEEQNNIKNEILKTLQKNNNVVAGLIYNDEEGFCTGGHEVTIVGYTKNLQGRGFFIIQDSDDYRAKPELLEEEELLKLIHHALL